MVPGSDSPSVVRSPFGAAPGWAMREAVLASTLPGPAAGAWLSSRRSDARRESADRNALASAPTSSVDAGSESGVGLPAASAGESVARVCGAEGAVPGSVRTSVARAVHTSSERSGLDKRADSRRAVEESQAMRHSRRRPLLEPPQSRRVRRSFAIAHFEQRAECGRPAEVAVRPERACRIGGAPYCRPRHHRSPQRGDRQQNDVDAHRSRCQMHGHGEQHQRSRSPQAQPSGGDELSTPQSTSHGDLQRLLSFELSIIVESSATALRQRPRAAHADAANARPNTVPERTASSVLCSRRCKASPISGSASASGQQQHLRQCYVRRRSGARGPRKSHDRPRGRDQAHPSCEARTPATQCANAHGDYRQHHNADKQQRLHRLVCTAARIGPMIEREASAAEPPHGDSAGESQSGHRVQAMSWRFAHDGGMETRSHAFDCGGMPATPPSSSSHSAAAPSDRVRANAVRVTASRNGLPERVGMIVSSPGPRARNSMDEAACQQHASGPTDVS